MAFALRRPFAVTSALKQISKPSSSTLRAFHQAAPLHSPLQQPQRLASKSSLFAQSKNVFQSTFRRNVSQQAPSFNAGGGQNLTQRLIYGVGIFGGTLVAINLIFNRETREDGGMPPFERKYLNDTMMHTGLGLGIIAISARALHMNGWSYRLMAANPWAVLGIGLVGSIGTMMGTFYTAPEKYVLPYHSFFKRK